MVARQESVSQTELGEVLLGELRGCSCHEAEPAVAARLGTPPTPDLTQVGRRVTPQYLRRYLTDPQSVKPGALMPNVFHRSAAKARDGAVDYQVHFLVALSKGQKQSLFHATHKPRTRRDDQEPVGHNQRHTAALTSANGAARPQRRVSPPVAIAVTQ